MREIIQEAARIKERVLQENIDEIKHLVNEFVKTIKGGGKIILFGNGGSAADAQHIACELVGRFKMERKGLPAIALTTNTSVLTSVANDYNFAHIFSRQLEALGNKGDIAVGISTSGKAENVIEGLKKARELGLTTVAFTGEAGDNLKKLSDICLQAPSRETPRIQEVHILVGHIICGLVEKELML
ncbi:MAG: D-sedoheptulose 7-phosphate isomerase [Caldiserica bacterium]|nr:D-sedoheptulose 7-phosphate isomerase [Caldisericota bacterium]